MKAALRRLLALVAVVISGGVLQADVPEGTNRTAAPTPGGDREAIVERATRRAVLNQARAAAAARTKEALKAKGGRVDPKLLGVNPAKAAPVAGVKGAVAGAAVPGPGAGSQLQQPDYMFATATNWHNTKPIHKFVDTLPGLGAANANNLGNYIPVAVANTTKYPGSDYYEIDVVEYTQRFHSDLAPTKLRGYAQHLTPGVNTISGGASNYLGPVIVATKDRPVRVMMRNQLPTTTSGGNLFIPVDTTLMGAGLGANGSSSPVFSQNRAEFHLHGGLNPWISDGTPHQWVTPVGESNPYLKGVAFQNVPDMGTGTPSDGIGTYFWSNQQSGRLMFYHDHSFGLTRLNVYAGEAAGYLIVDPVDTKLITAGILPGIGTPLVIQDKTFVDTSTMNIDRANPAGLQGVVGMTMIEPDPLHPGYLLRDSLLVDPVKNPKGYVVKKFDALSGAYIPYTSATDPIWLAGVGTPATDPTWDIAKYGADGSLWYPHVYMPNQNPADISGANAMGRWDYGPWFWPPLTAAAGLVHGAEPIQGDPNGTEIPGTPNPSLTPEAFMDTPIVNGTAYPRLAVQPQAYRFRILNAANDRFWNLSFFQADTSLPDANGRFTEVKMVPSAPNASWPATWPTDGRAGGVPDPLTKGPDMIQIGNESGFLPNPVVIPAQPVGYNYNRRDIVVLNVQDKALFLGPAERADVIVDFSAFAGKSLILYNDAPAPVPAFDTRLDYYTGAPDQRDSGGADTTLPGYGPNTRTIMLIEVAGDPLAAAGTYPAYDTAPLFAAFTSSATSNGAFAEAQHPPIVPNAAYNTALGKTLTTPYIRIQDNQFRLPFPSMENGDLVQPTLEPKAIQELFELDYGRMNATLGVELPVTNFNTQTTIPLGYVDPATEILTDGTTQYWKITHNGVDTHPVHFHLFDVQVINRVGWDGAVRYPDANEFGWKETVKMNPLEDIIVAFRPLSPRLPFALPSSVHSPSVTQSATSTIAFTNPLDGNPINLTNAGQNFGWEYAWHCHILGHEENDFMRPLVLNVATTVPKRPINLSAAGVNASRVDLAWTDQATDETGFTIYRRAAATTDPFVAIGTSVPNSNHYSDYSVANPARYDYRVAAYNQAGDSPLSNIATVGVATVSVSGNIANGATPVAGIVLSVSNGQTTVSDASGNYTYTVPVGFTGTATPTTANYQYTPASFSYTNLQASQTAQNFNAIPVITVTGKVTSGVTNLAGVTVTASTGQTATTDAAGLYTLVVSSPFTGTIRATKAAYFITAAPNQTARTYTAATTNQTAQNFTAVAGIAVSGRVTNGTAGLGGVTISLTNGYSLTTASTGTAANIGTYTTYVPSAYTGTISAALNGYAFTPATVALNNVRNAQTGKNFAARAAWSVSGTVTTMGLPVSGVTLTFSPSNTAGVTSVTTGANGTYTALVNQGWTGTITATKTGSLFSAALTGVTVNGANVTGKNFITMQTIAGTTKRASNNGNVNGVIVTATGATGFSTYTATSAGGAYTLTVPTGWTGTVSAAGGGFTNWYVGSVALNTKQQAFTSVITNQTGLAFVGQ